MKLASIALCLLAACSVSAAPPAGERVRYTVQFATGSDEATLKQVVAAYKERLGPKFSAAEFRADASSATITTELAVNSAFEALAEPRKLVAALAADAHQVELSCDPALSGPGLLRIDDEWLRLGGSACERGIFGSTISAHAAGARLMVFEDGLVYTLLSARGEIEFLAQATKEFLGENGTTLEAEYERFLAWRKWKPAARLADFDAIARDQGGPLPGCVWRRRRASEEHVLLVRSTDPRFRFAGKDISQTGFSQDSRGFPAVSFGLAKERQGDFSDWTQKILGQGLAIVLDEEILTLATVRSRLPGSGIIEGGTGGFSKGEVQALVRLLRLSPLPLQPQSVTREFLH